ncbi:uncharacterized protein [Halyomorpha halys]|uniref:uncharacterized protein n=1 Tax=Halyomorpha halys TaxID=286706 RepID=UPI0006D4EC8A|nr:uncharacterized protein LOC106689737 [Halyomorpha halys]
METEEMFKEVKKYSIIKDRTSVDLDKKPERKSSSIKQLWHLEGDTVNNKRKSLKSFPSKCKKLEKGNTSSAQLFKNRKWPWCSHMQLLNESMTRIANISCHSQTAEPMEHIPQGSLKRMKKCSQESIDKSNHVMNNHNLQPDDIDHLFMSYAFTFRRISPKGQAKLKMDLASLFAKAELGDLNLTS